MHTPVQSYLEAGIVIFFMEEEIIYRYIYFELHIPLLVVQKLLNSKDHILQTRDQI